MELTSEIVITHQPNIFLERLKSQKSDADLTIIESRDERGNSKEFLLEDAQMVIEKAHIASQRLHYIVLVAPRFSEIAQNRLLKVLEEPPKNKIFILITASKSALLKTILSRLPLRIVDERNGIESSTSSLIEEPLTLSTLYRFTQTHSKISVEECRELIEKISLDIMNSEEYSLDAATLEYLSNALRALDVGAPTSFVLNAFLLRLLAVKNLKD